MKKVSLFLFAAAMSLTVSAQNVARECVLFEVFTGVNCPYCPAAANGIAQMLEEGLAIAPVAIHTSAFSTEEFYTDETNARANFYGISAYPTAKVDGILMHEGGGNSSQSNYSAYLSRYNQRINVESPFTIDLSCTFSGSQCQVNATVTQVGECTGTNVRIFIVMTQSHIQRNWQGMPELNCVVRDFIPTQNGTPFSGGTQTVTETFDLNGYPKEDCHLVAWVQNYSAPKEVYQAVKISLQPENLQYDLAVKKIEEVVTENCSGKVAPRVTVKTFGPEALTSMLLTAYADGVEVSKYQWNGNVAQGETAEVLMPEFDFGNASLLSIEASLPNGHDDEFPADNAMAVSFSEAKPTDGLLKMQIKTGQDPQDITYELKNSETGEIVELWSYDVANQVNTKELHLMDAACYRLSVRNSEGLGINSGFFVIKNSEGQTVYQANNNVNPFRYELAFEFSCDGTLDVNELNDNELSLYPNPASSFINISGMNLKNIVILNSLGQTVYEKSGEMTDLQIDTKSFSNGLYYVNLTAVDGSLITKKFIVNK